MNTNITSASDDYTSMLILDSNASGFTIDNRCHLVKGHDGDHENNPNLLSNSKVQYELCNYELVYLASWKEREAEEDK